MAAAAGRDAAARRRVQAADLPVRLPGPRRGRACGSWPTCARRPACRSSPRSSTPTTSSSSRPTPTCSRSAPATCRTSACCRPSARWASRCMLKRGMSATIEEWLMAAEYVAQRGNLDIVLCERGIRTFETATRNTLDISRGPARARPLAPAGHRRPVAQRRSARPGRAAVAGGDRGRRRRHHRRRAPEPDTALCDGAQALVNGDLRALAAACRSCRRCWAGARPGAAGRGGDRAAAARALAAGRGGLTGAPPGLPGPHAVRRGAHRHPGQHRCGRPAAPGPRHVRGGRRPDLHRGRRQAEDHPRRSGGWRNIRGQRRSVAVLADRYDDDWSAAVVGTRRRATRSSWTARRRRPGRSRCSPGATRSTVTYPPPGPVIEITG